MSRTRRTFTLVCLAGLLVTGCSAAGPANTSAGTAAIAGSNGGDAKAPSVNQPGDSKSGASQSAGGQTSLPPADNGRQVVRTATINVTTDHVTDTVAKIRAAAAGVGGYSSDQNSSDDHGTLTLKVPADKLDAVLKTIGSYATKVTSQSEHAEDVTDQMVDVTSRLATQRASVDRVRALMDKATSLSDITQIESELTKREADLESLEQRHDTLAAQVAMSTVTVDVSRTAAPPPPVEDQATFLSALGAGWHALVATVNGIGVGLGAILPFLLVIGIPAGAVYVYLRQRKARSQPAP
ncbi:DUF4349 domain-containing protein [Kutzneria buriramensis]|uniref:Uncharacterized protein DUF4349 n=1 Tax=Kutzneria buriramensis TaxID=1045776 RepID=A0A3E0I9A4_9PSEU|nr:DUF4349 domain-containing protein [Kutzneria buriramensis]REH55312.1 uncharacterized protein DUF4349 [Kutzneria buriramensis]